MFCSSSFRYFVVGDLFFFLFYFLLDFFSDHCVYFSRIIGSNNDKDCKYVRLKNGKSISYTYDVCMNWRKCMEYFFGDKRTKLDSLSLAAEINDKIDRMTL